MKKMKFCLLILIVCFVLPLQLHGQDDSIKANLNLSGEVLKKLDKKEIVEINKFNQKLAYEKEKESKPDDPNGLTVPVLIVVFLTFSLLFSLISLPFYFNNKKTKGRYLLINNLIEKGSEIPKELIAPATKSVRSDFHKGIILIALGISIIIVLLALKIGSNFWTIGLMPVFVGIGYLISYKFDNLSRRKNEIE
jgi:Domain of unknown function (DUF6249)